MMTQSPSTPPRPILTVAMIVRDAARSLTQTLDSVRAIADATVVLDTGSRDNSVAVAREAGADVFESAWEDDFAAARNECARHVGGDWTLWLDAGETIDNLAAEQLRQFVDRQAESTKAYLLYIRKPMSGGETSGEQIGQLRLLPTGAGLTFTSRVRESVLPSVVETGLEVDALECAIDRPPSDAEPEVQRRRAERNLRLAELSIAEDGSAPTMLNVRAQALAELGRETEAADVYRDVIATSHQGSTEMLEAYYGLLTILDGQPNSRERSMATCLEALEIYPLDAQLLCGMGYHLLHQRRLDLAARSYELAATHGQVDPGTWHLTDLADVATACQCLALHLMGEADQARAVLKAALELRPESASLRRQLIDLYVKAGHEAEAIRELDDLPDDTPDLDKLSDVVAGAVRVAAGDGEDGLPQLTAALEFGCRDPLCFRWLATAHLQLGNLDAAEAVLNQWQESDPASREIDSCRLALSALRQTTGAAAGNGTDSHGRPRPSGINRPVTA